MDKIRKHINLTFIRMIIIHTIDYILLLAVEHFQKEYFILIFKCNIIIFDF